MKRLAPDSAGIAQAADVLRAGHLVALPTETVYGLGGDAREDRAVAAIFAAKGRPRFNPLIAHVLSFDEAAALIEITPAGQALAKRFWPGPLTLVGRLRRDANISGLACAGLASAAIRVPAHPLMRAVLAAFQGPIAAPSANRSGRLSPTDFAAVAAELAGRVDFGLDGGTCMHGLESTIVSLSGDRASLLRPGAIARAEIEALIGPLAGPDPANGLAAPGMLASHYAPAAELRLEAQACAPGEAALDFAGQLTATGRSAAGPVLDLSPEGDLTEAAANLFAYLRRLDASGAPRIAIAPIPAHGLGEAINDRLRRAAAPRDSR